MSESLFIVNVLPSLVYPSVKLNIEQDEICKALIVNQARNWMNSTEMLLVIYAHSWDFLKDS